MFFSVFGIIMKSHSYHLNRASFYRDRLFADVATPADEFLGVDDRFERLAAAGAGRGTMTGRGLVN